MRVIEAPLVERERELEALGHVLEDARRGEGGVAVVEGPAGIGKSRLLAAAGAAGEDLEVLRARSSELERDFPFGVVRQLFEPVLFAASAEARTGLLAGAGALAERALGGSPRGGEGTADAFATLHGLYWFAANLASSRPVLLLVDDAQWSDGPSLRWLSFLVRRLEGMPLSLVLAVRTGEVGAEEALLDELVSDPSVRAVSPAVLSDAGVARLVEAVLGDAPDPGFLTACQGATGGNPFLLRELLGELAAGRVGATAENAPLVERLSARGVGRAVRARLRRQAPGCLELARAVSVLGDGCELTEAARLAGLSEPTAAKAADALAAASLLDSSMPLQFVHPLVRASVYEELGARERSDWHASAASALAEAGADVDRIAVHLLAADPRGDEHAIAILRAAAESARSRGANDVAATYLRRALREPPAPAAKPELLHELGAAELRAGEIEAAVVDLADALDGTTEASHRALVALDLASALLFTNRPADAVDVLGRAIERLAGGDAELAARLATVRAQAALSSLAGRRRLPPREDTKIQAIAKPRTVGERLDFARRAGEEVLRGTAEEARALALLSLGDGELLDATGAHHPPLYFALGALVYANAFDDAEYHLQATLRDARTRGSEAGFAAVLHNRTALCWRRGMLSEVEADARAALTTGIAPRALPMAAVHLADALVERGDADAAAAQLRAVELDAGTPEHLIGVFALVTRARVRLAQGRPEEALELLLECGRVEDAWQVATPSLTSWRAEAAVLLDRLGDATQARGLAGEAVRRADAFGSPVARGVALRAAALVSRPPNRDGLAASVAVLRGSGALLEFARSLVEHGAALRRAGRRADARDALRGGLELAAECGADALARRGHDELVAAGARPRRDPIQSRSTLTASELRVARMAAEGMTNREIAQALFLTEKTIEVHLTRVYRKLDIQSRSQLARALPAASPV